VTTFQRIYPCPLALNQADVTTTIQAACLIHVARCGLQGCCATSAAEAMGLQPDRVAETFRRLQGKGLLKAYAMKSTRGTARLCVVTKKAWEVLISPVSYELFPDADKPCVEGGSDEEV
jgi:predicted transcriptional regulator